MNLGGIDLNLLVALDALLSERSVTRAAQRVGLSQPGMSNALARLRRLFGDPLLVRRGAALVPTARAEALAGPVREALALIQRRDRRPARASTPHATTARSGSAARTTGSSCSSARSSAGSPPTRPGWRSRSSRASRTRAGR